MSLFKSSFWVILSLVVLRSQPYILLGKYQLTQVYPVAVDPGQPLQISLKIQTTSHDQLNLPLYNIEGLVMDVLHFDLDRPTKADAFHQYVNLSCPVPDLPSGIYSFDQRNYFMVKAKGPKRMALIYPENTIQAYNNYGKSFYGYNSSDGKPADTLSFNRPVEFFDEFFSLEFGRWLAKTYGDQIAYFTDRDLDHYENIAQSDVLIIPGHSEYWSRKARENFDHFVDGGKHAIILSGNTCWWQVRYHEDQIICHKEDGTDPTLHKELNTVLWSDPTLQYSILKSIGQDFSLGGYGKQVDSGWDGYRICVNNNPLFENTKLQKGDTLKLSTTEYDGTVIKDFYDGFPIIDAAALGFHQATIIGFDRGFRDHETFGTWIAFKKKQKAGTVFNVGSTNWCESNSFLSNSPIPVLTQNMIELVLDATKLELFWKEIQAN